MVDQLLSTILISVYYVKTVGGVAPGFPEKVHNAIIYNTIHVATTLYKCPRTQDSPVLLRYECHRVVLQELRLSDQLLQQGQVAVLVQLHLQRHFSLAGLIISQQQKERTLSAKPKREPSRSIDNTLYYLGL